MKKRIALVSLLVTILLLVGSVGVSAEENTIPIMLYRIDAPLNQVSGKAILGELDLLNIAELTPFREVALCIVWIPQLNESQIVHFIWRDTCRRPMFIYGHTIPSGESVYPCFSYQAYVPWEIWEVGTYSVDILLDGKLLETKYLEVK